MERLSRGVWGGAAGRGDADYVVVGRVTGAGEGGCSRSLNG